MCLLTMKLINIYLHKRSYTKKMVIIVEGLLYECPLQTWQGKCSCGCFSHISLCSVSHVEEYNKELVKHRFDHFGVT